MTTISWSSGSSLGLVSVRDPSARAAPANEIMSAAIVAAPTKRSPEDARPPGQLLRMLISPWPVFAARRWISWESSGASGKRSLNARRSPGKYAAAEFLCCGALP